MEQFELLYDAPNKLVQPRADITVLEPGELPSFMFPGQKVVIVGEPYPYDGFSVTNGANYIAHALMAEHGLGPFTGCVYVEHYTQGGMSDREAKHWRKPDFDVVRFKWEMVHCKPPYKIAPRFDQNNGFWWRPLPYLYYPPLLRVLSEPLPEWIHDKAATEADKWYSEIY